MHQKTTRFITWLLLFAICASLCALPVMAAAEDNVAEPGDVVSEETAVSAVDEEPVLVNVIDDEPAVTEPEPAAETPVADEPADEPAPENVDPADAPSEETEPAAEGEASEEPELDGAVEYTVSYYSGTTLLSEETVAAGGKPVNVPTTDGSGKNIKAWLDSANKRVVPGETAVTADVSFYAWFAPALNTVTHESYINGLGNGKFAPTGALTRAQAATILYKLLESKAEGPFSTSFSDVSATAWYATAVKTLASIGVINGYTDGTFRPNNNVTRAEFVTMLVNLTGATGSDVSFSDVSAKHWARNAIAAASANGWVNGYTDGTFRPGNNITRAEAVVVMNRVLGRSADKEAVKNGTNMVHFLDVSTTAWYYYDVMEAAVGHEFTKTGTAEVWTSYAQDASSLTPGLHKDGSTYFYVSSSGQLVHMVEGINYVDGKFFYAPSAGYTFTGDLSSRTGYVVFSNGAADQQLKNGFNQIANTLFYWSLADNAAQHLIHGINKIGSRGYWANEDGYNIRNYFTDASGTVVRKGVTYIEGKYYLTDGSCGIFTTGNTTDIDKVAVLAYASPSSKPGAIDLKKHTLEYNGYMYYVKDDYSLATDEWIGLLYFGANCRYTSGDSTLDGYVYNVVKSFVNNNALTQVQKLLKAYYYMRGGEGKTYETSPFGYTRINQLIMDQRRYNRQRHIQDFISCAKSMFSLKRGMCYQWAAAYLYMARRLGFQAYPVAGRLNGSSGPVHCWDMIYWDGYWHLSDVEYEWGYLSGYYGGGYKVYRNLFDQTLSVEWATSYTSPESGLVYAFPAYYDKKPTVYY